MGDERTVAVDVLGQRKKYLKFRVDIPLPRGINENSLAFRNISILIIEDDSRISRLLRTHLEAAFPSIRVEIGGSAAKAKTICEKHPPTLIIWDGIPNERGTREEYAGCVPDELWSRVIPISNDKDCLEFAKAKNSRPAVPKPEAGHNTWSEQVVALVRKMVGKKVK